MKCALFILVLIALITGLFSCRKMLPQLPEPEETLAEPLEGLTQEQLLLFSLGDANFAHVFSKEQGLGPIFVQTSCEGCHAGDGKGNPFNNITRFGKYENGNWNPLYNQGGPQLQQRAITGYLAETIPSGVSSDELLPMNVTGLGLLEAVPDSTLLALSDSADGNGDGISGKVNWLSPPSYFIPKSDHITLNGKYIGRFGRKASSVDLVQRVTDAFHGDIGITSDHEMTDPFNYTVSGLNGDNVADPEIPFSMLSQTVFYMRTLKAPPRRNIIDPDVQAGENIFIQTGCAKCHVPTLTTGNSEIESLDNKTFHPYTDLLLHDMGAGLDKGYTEGSARSSEWRTPPLWGFGLQEDSQGGMVFLLHDGRAKTVEQAISYHGGEASTANTAFQALSESDKQKLIAFLKSL
ncbi:MAG: c-type cytochrome [Bacteroidetes bacterium]|nr:MAG: c-type cytochrome [Bacteroidota bacterium]